MMRFYNQTHPFDAGVDLHARTLADAFLGRGVFYAAVVPP